MCPGRRNLFANPLLRSGRTCQIDERMEERNVLVQLITNGILRSFGTLHFKRLNRSGNGVDNRRLACKIPTVHRIRALRHACSWIQEKHAWIVQHAHTLLRISMRPRNVYIRICVSVCVYEVRRYNIFIKTYHY